jgi:signal transduction histidine kinase
VTPLVASPWLAGATAAGLRFAAVVLALVAVAVSLTAALRRLTATSRVPLLLAAGCAAIELAWALVPGARAVIGPFRLDVPYLLQVRATAHAAMGAALLTILVVHARRRAAFRRLAREITEVTPPDSIREVVAARLRDPQTQLAFHIPEEGVWVDELGERVEDPTNETLAHTATLRREGRVVAQIRLGTPSAAPRDLEEVLGPATLLALEAERTRVEQLLRLRVLRETRRHVVEATDAARRRAERDLHDGAQHLLLAATFALQDGLQRARESGDEARAHRLERALDEVRGAAGELRRVAHGIYPVLLGDAGLVPALEGLARSSPVPTTVDATPVPRFDASGELTAYRAAALATRSRGTGPLHIAVACDDSTLRMTLHGAVLDADATQSMSDRVLALGGTMESVDSTLNLELPCG